MTYFTELFQSNWYIISSCAGSRWSWHLVVGSAIVELEKTEEQFYRQLHNNTCYNTYLTQKTVREQKSLPGMHQLTLPLSNILPFFIEIIL